MKSRTRKIWIEILNTFTHGLGSILGILGLVLLLNKENITSSEYSSYVVYGMSMIILFGASAFYHAFSFTPLKKLLQKIDHASIYLLIAGSYTPYLVAVVGGKLGYSFLALIWLAAVAGIIFEVIWTNHYPKLSTYLYLAMGWLGVFLIYPLYQLLDKRAMILLIIGGLSYTLGSYFYQKKHLDWIHIIWHIFVLTGAFFIYLSIYLYV
ncbi:MAG: hemolysin III family protein [Atopostipes sp.]|nr:hemolysin III family protein [Atopostipes sp.]